MSILLTWKPRLTEMSRFFDVKELVVKLPVGGNTRPGQLLKDFLLYQIELENQIPKVSYLSSFTLVIASNIV